MRPLPEQGDQHHDHEEPDPLATFASPTNQQVEFHQNFLRNCVLVGLAAAILFSALPSIDLAVAAWFRADDGHFVFQRGVGRFARTVFMWSFAGFVILGVVGAWRGFWFEKLTIGQPTVAWTYLIVCFIAGPLLLTNVILKDNWGRARPKQVEDLGGTKIFTPALQPTDQCERNCSFISGEASSIFMLFFALAMLFPTYQRQLAISGIVFGGVSGIVRMGAGGHFLSDVVFAGVFMALTAYGVYAAFGHYARNRSD